MDSNVKSKKKMEIVGEFLEKHIRIIHAIISTVLIILLTLAVIPSAQLDSQQRSVISVDDLPDSAFFGYSISYDGNGNKLYTPINYDPQFYVHAREVVHVNSLTLHFATPAVENQYIELFYLPVGTPDFTQQNSTTAAIIGDRTKAIAFFESIDTTSFRIDINYPFALEKITLEYNTVTRAMGIDNLVAAIILIAFVSVLFVFDKKIGYVSKVKEKILAAYGYVNDIVKSKSVLSYVKLAIRVLAVGFFIALVITAALAVFLAKMSTSIIVAIFALSFFFVAFFITDRILNDKLNVAVLFLVLALTFSMMLAITLPPHTGNSWDEGYHYARAVDIKCLFFNGEKTSADVWQESRNFTLSPDAYIADPTAMIFQLLTLNEIEIDYTPASLNLYKYLGHIPMAIMMRICEIMGFNYFATVIFMKLASAFIYAFVIYLGIRRLKSGAFIFSTVSLLPTAVFISVGFSYDYFVTAFITYAMAYFISELQQPDKLFSLRDGIFMFGAFLLGCGPKAIYVFLGIPFIFMHKCKFGSKKARNIYRAAAILVMIVILLSFVIPFLTDQDSMSDLRGGSTVDAAAQLKYILTEPFEYAEILIKFMGEYVSLYQTSYNVVNYCLVGSEKYLCATLYLVVLAFCVLADKSDIDRFKGHTMIKLLSVLCFVISIAFVATSLYISYTPLQHTTVNGCQWRYLIPMLSIFLYSIGTAKITNNVSKKIMTAFVFGAMTLVLFASFHEIYILDMIQ